MNNKRKILIAVLGLVSIVLIGVGASLAFFSFTQTGTTENTIEAGTIEFHYDEVSKKGAGISLVDALPVDSNAAEMAKNNYFEFNVTAKTANQPISYVVTAKKSADSDDLDGIVDLYLTDDTDTALFGGLHRYNNYVQYRNKTATEKVIYTGTVPVETDDYNQEFRLRMWIDQNIDFSGRSVTKYFCSGTEVELNSAEYNNCDAANLTQTTDMEYDYNGKTFKITVNVYTDTSITGYEPVSTASTDATLSSLSVNGCTFRETFDPETTYYSCSDAASPIPYDSLASYINYTTTDPNATVKLDMTIVGNFSVSTYPYGYNIGVTVTAADGTTTKTYSIDHYTERGTTDATLSSLSVAGCTFSETFNPIKTTYRCSSYTAPDGGARPEATFTTTNPNATTDSHPPVGDMDIVDENDSSIHWRNIANIAVTAEDGTTTKLYTVLASN